MDEKIQEAIIHIRELAVIEDYPEIFKILHRLNDEHPNSHIPPHWLAYYLMVTDQLDEALSYCDIAIKRAPFEPGPTITYVSILFELKRYTDARVQMEILRSLDRTNRYKEQALSLLEKIYLKAVEYILPSPSLHDFEENLPKAVSIIMGDTCSTIKRIQESSAPDQYYVEGIGKNYVVWVTDNTLHIQLDSPNEILHNHIVFEGHLTDGLFIVSQSPSSGIESYKKKLDSPSFFKAVINICDVFRKDPTRLFYVEHGMDSGEWGPEEEFSPSDYERIIEECNGAVFGYQINFDLETWQGWIKGRSNIGYGTWIEGEGSKEMIARLKTAILHIRLF